MASATEVLRLLITADAKGAVSSIESVGKAADKDLKKAEAGSKRLGDAFLKTGAVMVGASAAIAVGLASTVKSALDSEHAQLKLQNTLDKMPKLAGANVSAFNKQASAIQNVTVVSDEAVNEAQAMLGTFNLTEKQILKITPLVVDYARKFGTDVVDASKQVGKALMGQIGALQRNGVTIDQTAYKADRFNAVFTALKQQAGGFATQEGKTLDGQLKILSNHFDDFKESVGRGVISVLNDLLPLANKVGSAFGSIDEASGNTIGKVGAVAVGVLGVGGAFTFAAGAAIKARGIWSQVFSGAARLMQGATVASDAAAVAATAEAVALDAEAASALAAGVSITELTAANTRLAASQGAATITAEGEAAANAVTGVSRFGAAIGAVGTAFGVAAAFAPVAFGIVRSLGTAYGGVVREARDWADVELQKAAALHNSAKATKFLEADVKTLTAAYKEQLKFNEFLTRNKPGAGANAGGATNDALRREGIKTLDEYNAAVDRGLKRQTELKTKIDAINKALADQNSVKAQAAKIAEQVAQQEVNANQAAAAAALLHDDSLKSLTDEVKGDTDAQKSLADAINAVLSAEQDAINSALGYEGAQRNTARAADDATKAIKESNDAHGRNAEKLQEASDAQFKLKQAIAAQADAAAKNAEAQLGPNATALDKAKTGAEAYRRELENQANSTIPAVRIQALILLQDLNTLDSTTAKPAVEVQGTDAAKSKIQDIKTLLDGLNGKTATFRVDGTVYFAGNGGAIALKGPNIGQFVPHRAVGGPVLPNKTYLVGERGPELLKMGSSGGTVISNSALRRFGRQDAPNVTLNVENVQHLDEGQLAKKLAFAIG